MVKKCILLLILILSTSNIVSAGNIENAALNYLPTTPLITDQAYTNGARNWQVSIKGGYTSVGKSSVLSPSVSYGVINNIDILLELVDGDLFHTTSFDYVLMDFGIKGLLYKDDLFALSIKPRVEFLSLSSMFSGSQGMYDFSIFLIGSMDIGSLFIHENIGYDYLNNSIYLSCSGEFLAYNNIYIILNIGTRQFASGDLFAMGGFMIELSKTVYLDLGANFELKGTDDIYGLLGITFKL